jgi:ABC-type amino acid transport substrate-binding protein
MVRSRWLAALLIAFVACPVAPASAQPLTGTLKAIKERKAIVIGYRTDAYPLSFSAPDGQPVGYSIDLCRRIAEEAGKAVGIEKLEVRFVPVTAEGRFDAVASGKVDIECGITTATLSRMEKVDFTQLTFVDGGSLLVKKGSAIHNIVGLVDETVGVVPGTTTEKALRQALARSYVNARVVEVADHAAGMRALEAGSITAYAADRIILVGLFATSAQTKNLELAPSQFSYEPYAFMVRRGDADFRLVANRALARLYRSDDIVKVFGKWFGSLGKPGEALVLMYSLNGLPD